MERYADGDNAAFSMLYDELAPRLLRFAARQLRSHAAAEDVVQQALLQIHCARDHFRRGAAVLPWAYAIARRLVIDVSRRRDREDLRVDPVQDAEEPSGAAAPDDALHRKRSEAALRRDLLYLPPALRDAFELLKVEGLSVAESAKALGITRGMVKIRAYRATVALRSAALRRERVTPKAFASTTCSRGGCRPGSTSPARMTARSGARSGANGEKLELVVTRQPQRICRSSDCHRRPYCQGSAPSGP